MPATNKEEAFAELVKEYEDMWVAIIEVDGVEFVEAGLSTNGSFPAHACFGSSRRSLC